MENEKLDNGLADAVGMGGVGVPGMGGGPQISDATTIFKSLRWYMVSNFRQVLSQLYVESGLVQTLIDVPVDSGFQGGVDVTSFQLDEEQIMELTASLERDDDYTAAKDAARWTRLFGGAGVLIITDQDVMTPLDISKIGPDTPLKFRGVDMWELYFDKQNTEGFNPTDLSDSEDEFYSYYGMKVHKSRVLKITGLSAPSYIRPRLRGWGYSVCEKLVRSINQYIKGTDLAFEVLDEFKLDVYKIKNLTNTLMSPKGEEAVRRRIEIANWQKNYQNAVVMDTEDDFDHKQLSFAGLGDAMQGIRLQIAADMRMPLTKLFGISASGFNSGEDDIEVYNSMVESEVRSKIKWHLIKMIEIKCQKLFGFIPDDLKVSFKPLRVMTSEQEENIKTQKFARLLQAKQAGEITRFEFREACNKENLLGISLDNKGDELSVDDPEIDQLVEGNMAIENPVDKSTEPVENSLTFDLKSYQADGGDLWIDARRRELFDIDGAKDKALFLRCVADAKELRHPSWQFVAWLYKKRGGVFGV